MVSCRFAPRVGAVCLAIFAVIILDACPQPYVQPASRKKPAEIDLPAQNSLATYAQIERDLSRFDWGPAHDAVCKGGCQAGDVTIRSIGATKDIKQDSGPAKLRIVALIQNYSNHPVTHTPSHTIFKPKTKYLMWVHSRNTKAVWGFIELGQDYNSTPTYIGTLEDCRHHKPPKPVSTIDDANFQDCDAPYLLTHRGGWTQSAYAATQGLATIDLPGWVTCDPDCCTGTTNQLAQ